ncbi:MAG: hypothetical protein PVF58_09245 [Candidatus Methanofastidiosia archaeon]|jgi:hypothetical protein
MAETGSENDEEIWIKFLRKHWKMIILFVIGAILALIGVVLVFLRFVGDAQLTGLVPETLGLWTMNHVVTFVLRLIFWEVLYIGIPVIVAIAIIFFLWWKRLPHEEREEYKRKNLFGTDSHSTSGGQGISLVVLIAFIIKVFRDGNWHVPIAEWTFDYLVYSYLRALIWIVIIIGIPLALGGIGWIFYKMKKKP